MIAVLLFALASAQANAAPATGPQAPFAIECTGAIKSKARPSGRETSASTNRTYVVDEAAKSIGYWNPSLGRLVPICAPDERCEADFSPNMLFLNASDGIGGSANVVIDRRAGTYWEQSLSSIQSWEFKGTCRAVPLPHADPTERKF